MDLDAFYFKDWLKYTLETHGNESWVILQKDLSDSMFKQRGSFYSALIKKEESDESLKKPGWDLKYGDGVPGFVTRYEDGKELTEYLTNTSFSSCEPIVRYREFHGIRENYLEVGEEIRLFHNLYHDKARNKYISFDERGEDVDVIVCADTEIKIRKKYLKEFMAAKQMDLLLFFDITRHASSSGAEGQDLSIFEEDNCSDSFIYTRYAGDISFGEDSLFSRLLGKKLISCDDPTKSGVYPYEKRKSYQDFIIGEDENGDLLTYTSNPDELADYFGGNPDAPHYLTPVFFNKDVLARYYGKPSLFSVEDCYIRCGGLWGVRIDNNKPDYVCVFLGDLGRDLPEKEQVYWKSFNIPPEGNISETYFKRSFLGEFTGPSSGDLVFKYKFSAFQKTWYKKYGWYLFLPLSENDEHLFTALRIPINNDQSEFDGQILALAKTLIDSINEKQLSNTVSEAAGLRGIGLLEKYLEENSYPNRDDDIELLRAIYNVRSSGVGHRKGSKYEKAISRLGISEDVLIESFQSIIERCTLMIERMAESFLEEKI